MHMSKKISVVAALAVFMAGALVTQPVWAVGEFTATASAPLTLLKRPEKGAPVAGTVPTGTKLFAAFAGVRGPWAHIMAATDELVLGSPKFDFPPVKDLPALHAEQSSPEKVVLHSTVTSFKCEEDYIGPGYRNCVVGVDLCAEVPDQRSVSLGVTCTSKVEFAKNEKEILKSTASGEEIAYFQTYGGSGHHTLTVKVRRPAYLLDPVFFARMKDGECRVDSVN